MKKKTYLNTFKCLKKVDAEFTVRIMKKVAIDKEGTLAHDDYQRKTTDRKVPIKCGGFTYWVGLPCSDGNSKIDKGCLVSKLLPISTCPNCKQCMNDCYAIKDTYRYPNTLVKELLYTYLAWDDPKEYFRLIEGQIKRKRKKVVYFRLHEAGDFFNREYLDAALDFIRAFKDIQFFTYTKTEFEFDRPENLNIVESLLDLDELEGKKKEEKTKSEDKVLNFGPKEKIDRLSKKYSLPICPCGKKDNKETCMGTCKLCAHCKNVLFYEH